MYRDEGNLRMVLEALEEYLKTLEELSEPKNQDIKDPQKSPMDFKENLEEQIIKLIKPYLHERIKSKRIGATK